MARFRMMLLIMILLALSGCDVEKSMYAEAGKLRDLEYGICSGTDKQYVRYRLYQQEGAVYMQWMDELPKPAPASAMDELNNIVLDKGIYRLNGQDIKSEGEEYYTLQAKYLGVEINASGRGDDFAKRNQKQHKALLDFFGGLLKELDTDVAYSRGYFEKAGGIERFEYSYGSGFSAEPVMDFRLYKEKDIVLMEVDAYDNPVEGSPFEVEASALTDLKTIMSDNMVNTWDGFEGYTEVTDGFGYTLDVLMDNAWLRSEGYAEFPDYYWAGHRAMEQYLMDLYEEERM